MPQLYPNIMLGAYLKEGASTPTLKAPRDARCVHAQFIITPIGMSKVISPQNLDQRARKKVITALLIIYDPNWWDFTLHAGLTVNRRWIGTPDRRSKGAPFDRRDLAVALAPTEPGALYERRDPAIA